MTDRVHQGCRAVLAAQGPTIADAVRHVRHGVRHCVRHQVIDSKGLCGMCGIVCTFPHVRVCMHARRHAHTCAAYPYMPHMLHSGATAPFHAAHDGARHGAHAARARLLSITPLAKGLVVVEGAH